ncbi:MAG: GTP cyclohydrolase II [Granulosicoccus sp.]|nr:GTP cyclohydrolase II [Granulosicoccus sp.]
MHPASNKERLANQQLKCERCIIELHRGRAIALRSGREVRLVQTVELLDQSSLDSLLRFHDCALLLTRARAAAMDIPIDDEHVCLHLHADTTLAQLRSWCGLGDKNAAFQADSCTTSISTCLPVDQTSHLHERGTHGRYAKAALNLARRARVLPAMIIGSPQQIPTDVLYAEVEDATAYDDQTGDLVYLGCAQVPLATAPQAKLAVFREKHGNAEHAAITVGNPNFDDAVTVRLHSSCFTGDILGSLRCDCGEQLDKAIKGMADRGGGVVLYISQEGRGIGLASKLRAYQLQDAGLDTIEANEHLGFDADERSYLAAASILRALGITKLQLMTNNPLKIKALRDQGLRVSERIPLPATVNSHNARYLQTKREKAGHLSLD